MVQDTDKEKMKAKPEEDNTEVLEELQCCAKLQRSKTREEHTVKSTINKWYEAVGEDDCQEDEPLPVISESLDLVYFHELRVPIRVNTVPKCKLVFTKDLKNAAYNNKLGFLMEYDIR